jgi:hypothetical protein
MSNPFGGMTMINCRELASVNKTPVSTAVCLLLVLVAAVSSSQAAVIRDVRIGNQKGYLRIVLESDRPLPPPTVSADGHLLRISLDDVINAIPLPDPGEYRQAVDHIDITQTSGKTTIAAVLRFAPADIRTFSLTGPQRFIVDLYRSAIPDTATTPAGASASEPVGQLPEAYSRPHAALSRPLAEAARENLAATAQDDDTAAARPQQGPSQRQLIAVLIAVTSVIAGLLFCLLRASLKGKAASPAPRQDALPPLNDPKIERIDQAIREQFDIIDRL